MTIHFSFIHRVSKHFSRKKQPIKTEHKMCVFQFSSISYFKRENKHTKLQLEQDSPWSVKAMYQVAVRLTPV